MKPQDGQEIIAPLAVAPFTGAWIETQDGQEIIAPLGRPLHGGVD